MVRCSFTGEKIPPGTGKMYIRKDGRILYFRDRKAEKNFLKLKRNPRNVRHTAAARVAKEQRMAELAHEQEGKTGKGSGKKDTDSKKTAPEKSSKESKDDKSKTGKGSKKSSKKSGKDESTGTSGKSKESGSTKKSEDGPEDTSKGPDTSNAQSSEKSDRKSEEDGK